MTGNSNLSNAKLNEILSTCNNIEILSLRNLKNLISIEFVENMLNLKELDLFGCSNLTDLKILENLSTKDGFLLKTLRIDNPLIDLSTIQNTISNLDSKYAPGSLGFFNSANVDSGFYASAAVWKNLNNCDKITQITGHYREDRNVLSGEVIDLTGCSSLKTFKIAYAQTGKIIFPKSIIYLELLTNSYSLDIDFDDECRLQTFRLSGIEGDVTNENFSKIISSLTKCLNLEEFSAYCNGGFTNTLNSLNCMENLNNNITSISIFGFKMLTDIGGLSNFRNLETLDLHDCNISDVTALKNCTNLKTLSLNSNRITNLFFLHDMLQLNELNLQNNLIEDVVQNGENRLDNLNIITDLYENGNLRKLRISNNPIINWDNIKNLEWDVKDF